ncbi:MAG: diadenylate cyclase CdaA [Clostridiales Family XIII bacterium]|jgi:diadenylate cyclase|nr:diadenylate cyclase CdaA [Clostridiales Family XIII bacterium]
MSDYIDIIISNVGITDLLDVTIVAFVIYQVLVFIRETRAEQLIKGLLVLLVAAFLSGILNLYALNWILIGTMQFGVIALVVVFQPELRRGLEYVGRSKFFRNQFVDAEKENVKAAATSITRAVDYFSTTKTGAIIILERETSLNDIVESGVILDSGVSAELLKNIFYEGAPLHDGAVIIRRARVYAAGCVLPLTEDKDLSMDLGTRHRAGIGITENSDAIALIVSEETGIISMAVDGKLTRFLDIKTVEKTLLNLYLADSDLADQFNPINLFRRRKNAEEQDSK